MEKNERIVLGSGHLYIKEFEEGSEPTNAEIEREENLLGYIQGGASLEYAPSYYTAKDDMGKVAKTILTEEEVKMKSGVMTWNGKTLEKLCDTARVTESGGVRTVKIGGTGNQKGKKYLLHFHHEDKVDGDIRVRIVGNNQAGFSLAFAKDKETVIDAEFLALPMDKGGTLIRYEEELKDGNATGGGGTTSSPDDEI